MHQKNESYIPSTDHFVENPNSCDSLWTTPEAATRLKCSRSKLEKDRFEGKGIPYTRIGKSVRYREADIQKFLAANTVGGVA